MNGLYEVSNLGNVRRLRFINGKHNIEKIKMCKQTLNTWGYMTVNLCKNGKSNTKRVHRLVAVTFLGNSDLQVDHIDGNKENNKVENLEWCTQKYNMQEAQKNGLLNPGNNLPPKRKVKQFDLNNNFIKEWDSMIEIERKLNYKVAGICQCCKGKIKTAYNFIWKYAEQEVK